MSNPNVPPQDDLFTDASREKKRNQAIEDAEEAKALELNINQYYRYLTIVETGQDNPVGAWIKISGRTEEEYYKLKQKLAKNNEEPQQELPKKVTKEWLASNRPDWAQDPWVEEEEPPSQTSNEQPSTPIIIERTDLMQQLIDTNADPEDIKG